MVTGKENSVEADAGVVEEDGGSVTIVTKDDAETTRQEETVSELEEKDTVKEDTLKYVSPVPGKCIKRVTVLISNIRITYCSSLFGTLCFILFLILINFEMFPTL